MSGNLYNYMPKKILNRHLNCDDILKTYDKINLCVYKINCDGKIPFLRYLLKNNNFEDYVLPELPYYNHLSAENIISHSHVFLSGILKIINFNDFSKNVDFDGFYEFGESNKVLYLFFDVTNCELMIDETHLSNNVIFGLIDEIVNCRHICNISISENAYGFFIKNDWINYLYDSNNKICETPMVGFVEKQCEQKAKFVMTFGEIAQNKSAILGPYFYFTDFHNAIRKGLCIFYDKSENNYEKQTIIDKEKNVRAILMRFALFIGKTKYINNFPNDPNDESEIKKHRLIDEELDKNLEIMTLRISDHDGLWARTYDSAYLGKYELDDGSTICDTPLIVLKSQNQHIPLSYHFIDMTKERENLSEPYIIL